MLQWASFLISLYAHTPVFSKGLFKTPHILPAIAFWTGVWKNKICFLQLLRDPLCWELLPSTLHIPPDLFHSPLPQEPDSDDEWQHLLETTEPVPIQLKAPLTLLCNPDFCQRIQSQLHEAGAQVMGRRILWREFETLFTDEALQNIDWHKEKEKVCPFTILFRSICLIQGDLLTSFSNTERAGLGSLWREKYPSRAGSANFWS